MDWRILVFILLLLLACPIGMRWMMRHKPRSHDGQGTRGHEGGTRPHPAGDTERQLAQLEDRQPTVERDVQTIKEGRRAENDEKKAEGS